MNLPIHLKCVGSALAGVAIGGSICYLTMKSSRQALDSCFKSNWPFLQSIVNKTYIINSLNDFTDILTDFVKETGEVQLLGFDCEWTSIHDCSGHAGPVSLLQISTYTGLCLLIRLCHYKGNLPEPILNILKDKDILKVGVGPMEDAKKLLSDYGVIVRGCVDLRELAINRQTKSLSLKGLAATYLNETMNKSKSIQCSNWDANVLSDAQIRYAANDAVVAVKIFSAITSGKISQLPYSRKKAIISCAVHDAFWDVISSHCQGIKDCKFKDRKKSNNHSKPQKDLALNHKNNGYINYKPFKSYSTRKNPLYDNCKLQAPDGQLLSTCDKKKALWYIERGLAEKVDEDPFTVRLLFEPAGRPTSDRDYYLFDKENVCVVCGSDDSIVRKNVVPHEYRKHFPLVMKDHVSHDILPMCVPCHQKSGYYDTILRNVIADEYIAPLGSKQAVQLLEDPERRTVRSAGRALLGKKNQIPEPRKSELEKVITDFYSIDAISNESVIDAANLETRYKNEAYIRHGEKVVNTLMAESDLKGLLEFEKRWRKHFLSTMEPKHLPHLWSVEHNHDRVFVDDPSE